MGIPPRLSVVHEPALVRALLDSLDRASAVVRRDGSLVVANAAAESLLSTNGPEVEALLAVMQALGPIVRVATWSVGPLTAHHRAVEGTPYSIIRIRESTAADERRDPIAEAARAFRLTARQVEILRLLLEGQTTKDIATRLEVSIRTVEIHVTAIMAKTQVDSRARLLAAVMRLTIGQHPSARAEWIPSTSGGDRSDR